MIKYTVVYIKNSFKILKLCSLFLLISQGGQAVTCKTFLKGPEVETRSVPSTALVVYNPLTPTRSKLAEITEPSFSPDEVAVMSSDLSLKMSAAGLIHSVYFADLVRHLADSEITNEEAPAYISNLSPAEVNTLANKIYEDFVDNSSSFSEGSAVPGVTSPKLASEILRTESPFRIIDKIGEALIVTSSMGKLFDFTKDLNDLISESYRRSKMVKPGLSAGAALAGAVVGTALLGPLVGAEMVAAMGAGGATWLTGTLTAYGVLRPQALIRKPQMRAVRNLLGMNKKVQAYLYDQNFYQKPDKERILNQLQELRNFIEKDLEELRIAEATDIEIGRTVGDLRMALSRLFSREFSKWVNATHSISLKVTDWQENESGSDRARDLEVLNEVLNDAAGVTKEMLRVSELISSQIGLDIKKFESISSKGEPEDSASAFLTIATESVRSNIAQSLDVGQATQRQFSMTLVTVIKSLSSSIAALRGVNEVSMLMVTQSTLEQISKNQGGSESAPALIESLTNLSSSFFNLDLPGLVKVGKYNKGRDFNEALIRFKSSTLTDHSRLEAAEIVANSGRQFSVGEVLQFLRILPRGVRLGRGNENASRPKYYDQLEEYGLRSWNPQFPTLDLDILFQFLNNMEVSSNPSEEVMIQLNKIKAQSVSILDESYGNKKRTKESDKEERRGELIFLVDRILQEKGHPGDYRYEERN